LRPGIQIRTVSTLDSLQEYALVSETEPRVEVFRRQPSGYWLFSESVGLESVIRFDSVECSVPPGGHPQ
jgi:hypothetical protein